MRSSHPSQPELSSSMWSRCVPESPQTPRRPRPVRGGRGPVRRRDGGGGCPRARGISRALKACYPYITRTAHDRACALERTSSLKSDHALGTRSPPPQHTMRMQHRLAGNGCVPDSQGAHRRPQRDARTPHTRKCLTLISLFICAHASTQNMCFTRARPAASLHAGHAAPAAYACRRLAS